MLIVDTKWQKAYFREVPKDAWGGDFIYRVKSSKDFELFSSEPDGIEGTKDDVRLDGH